MNDEITVLSKVLKWRDRIFKVYKNNYTNCLYLYSGYCISHVFSVKGTVPTKENIFLGGILNYLIITSYLIVENTVCNKKNYYDLLFSLVIKNLS